MNELKIFKNEELGLQVRTIMNPDGSISVNAEDTAIGYGWSRTEVKNGKEYTSIMWARMNGYCKELGFAHECAKDDYIPESLFYMLGFKAGNERALKYQQWLAMDVLPSIRKTGHYEMPNMSKELQAIIMIDKKQVQMEERMDKLEYDVPLYLSEALELARHVRSKGVRTLGGKKSPAYKDNSIRQKLYCDLNRQLKREFCDDKAVSYKAMERKYRKEALKFIDNYEPPTHIKELIKTANTQTEVA